MFRAFDTGGLLGDLFDHIGADIFAWFATIDRRADALKIVEKLMAVERRINATQHIA